MNKYNDTRASVLILGFAFACSAHASVMFGLTATPTATNAVAGASSWNPASATVGVSPEFALLWSNASTEANTVTTLDITDTTITFTLTNNFVGDQINPNAEFNSGIEAFSFSLSGSPGINGVSFVSSTFTGGFFTFATPIFTANSITIDNVGNAFIFVPFGMGAVYTATWDVTGAAIPEPATFALIGLALAAGAGMQRLRRRASCAETVA
jgi:PEP-CTERM motif